MATGERDQTVTPQSPDPTAEPVTPQQPPELLAAEAALKTDLSESGYEMLPFGELPAPNSVNFTIAADGSEIYITMISGLPLEDFKGTVDYVQECNGILTAFTTVRPTPQWDEVTAMKLEDAIRAATCA